MADRALAGEALPPSVGASFEGALLFHLPAESGVRLLDADVLAAAEPNRWNAAGEPTLYLASDLGVALAELARHLPTDARPGIGQLHERRLLAVNVRFGGLIDLRDPDVLTALGIEGAPACFLDRATAGAVAARCRATDWARGLIVPSVAFLDRPERFNVVLFADRLASEQALGIDPVTDAGSILLDLRPGI